VASRVTPDIGAKSQPQSRPAPRSKSPVPREEALELFASTSSFALHLRRRT
jgi:hypothetical protein